MVKLRLFHQGFLYNDPPVIRSVIATPNPIVRMTQSHIVVDAADPEVDIFNMNFVWPKDLKAVM